MTSSSNTDREALRDIIAHWPIGSGYYQTSVGIDDAAEMADAILTEWLPAHDERVKAEAWDEGLLVGQDPYGFDTTSNPYRRES